MFFKMLKRQIESENPESNQGIMQWLLSRKKFKETACIVGKESLT